MEIREYKNGKFQVFDDDKVLRPCNLEWEGGYQSHHDFMFFSSFDEAESAMIRAKIKHEGKNTVTAVYQF